jgi:hypothetical protein
LHPLLHRRVGLVAGRVLEQGERQGAVAAVARDGRDDVLDGGAAVVLEGILGGGTAIDVPAGITIHAGHRADVDRVVAASKHEQTRDRRERIGFRLHVLASAPLMSRASGRFHRWFKARPRGSPTHRRGRHQGTPSGSVPDRPLRLRGRRAVSCTRLVRAAPASMAAWFAPTRG